jgi:polyisoprenyl-teichoic acid--peptidoglycan teichoic acid transferase
LAALFICGGIAVAFVLLPPLIPSPPALFGGPADGNGRITILLLGIDQRAEEAAAHVPSRSDTMIVLTIDPRAKRAALVSIPRDLVVAVPGHGMQKINTAHFWGETDHPGSGPELAKETVEQTFGIRVDYYARVDFLAFQRLVDAVDGVVIDVPRPILDDAYPTPDYGIQRIYIPAGPQWMDGTRALEYARSRHSENDFARQSRQRQVILAAEQRLFQPSTLLKLPALAQIARDSVGTDVPLTQVPALALLARTIPAQNVTNVGIGPDMVVDINHDGTELLPQSDKIRQLFSQIWDTPASAAAPAGPVRVEVFNGTTRPGFAAATADALKARGYVVANVAQAQTSDHLTTTIVDRSGSRQAGAAIAKLVGVPANQVQTASPQPGAADVTVILGFDAPDR